MFQAAAESKKILLVGYGDLAQRTAPHFVDFGCRVLGIARSEKPTIEGVDIWRGSVSDLVVQNTADTLECDIAIITLTPGGRRESDYINSYLNNTKLLINAWKRAARLPEFVIFVSSTSVYGQDSGEWVNEDSETMPSRDTAKVLLETENLLLSSGIKSCVVRFSGIYGPGRYYLLKQVYQGELGSPAYTNRIHADDCAGVLAFLVKSHWAGHTMPKLLLASDNKPVSSQVVREWLAKMMQEKDPDLDIVPSDFLAKPSNRVRGMNKRCDNSRLIKLGYRFRYPSYKEGFPSLVDSFLSPNPVVNSPSNNSTLS